MSYRSPVTNLKSQLLFFLLGLGSSSLSFGHSAMATDSFIFDNSNGGSAALATFNKTSSNAVSGDCIDGFAAGFPCKNIDLAATMTPSEMGSGTAMLNDIWGWTDPVTGNEIAIVGRTNGTSFVDVTDSAAPVFLGFLPTRGNTNEAWRDIKVFQDHAFIVADGFSASAHGMQVFDLNELFNVTPGSTLTETAHLAGTGASHNIAINEDSGFAYIVGSDSCSGGLYMVDISTPASPSFAGCFSEDGYTHDAQCVIYQGPDTRYTGSEICIAYNEDTVTIVDVSNKSNPVRLSRTTYPGVGYTHQGWFYSDEQEYIVMNDELDERGNGSNTTSYIFDVTLLDAPELVGRYVGPTQAIDHNLYSKANLVYETNYRAGLRVLGEVDMSQGCLEEVAYFDTIPNSNSAQFSGTWSSYIYFASGNIIVSDIETGLFVLTPDQAAIDAEVATLTNQIANCAEANDIPVAPEEPDTTTNGGSSGGGVFSFYMTFIFGLLLLIHRSIYGIRRNFGG